MVDQEALEAACFAWESSIDPWIETPVPCRSALGVLGQDTTPRVAYVGAGSPIEKLLGIDAELMDRAGAPISVAELTSRLLDTEAAAVLAPAAPCGPSNESIDVGLPESFLQRRTQIRRDNVLVRFLIRQIGLEEVTSHRGAPAELYHGVARRWSLDLALCTDAAMLLTLGADRQRYVDHHYEERATDRLPRALGRLRDMGVRSYPRLVII